MRRSQCFQTGSVLPEFSMSLPLFFTGVVLISSLIAYSFVSMGLISSIDRAAIYASSYSNEFQKTHRNRRSNKRLFIPNEEALLKSYFVKGFQNTAVYKYLNSDNLEYYVVVYKDIQSFLNTCRLQGNCLSVPTNINNGLIAVYSVKYKKFGLPSFNSNLNVLPDLSFSYISVVEHPNAL
ncbi:hypothetical protein L1D34_30285 [Vibrio mediterranei]|uniref:hypothetical protein n=1 Tax=Vibrio mediterranei TaxID=689 RepID=UPI001EFE2C0B|nr:hypothetical protein [Vibrio mediterranei]MCG9629083.1 hypothetical protein [Vibrio mediterranei]